MRIQVNHSGAHMAAKGKITIDRDLCKECHFCISVCKRNQIEPSKEYNAKGYRPVVFVGNGECTGCALCATMCPEIAIEVYRE
jgi:2-oxoglutarate ferredoxin oxidoreductase subunit delta